MGFGHKLKHTEHIAVVGDGAGGHAVILCLFQHFLDIGGPVEQAKLGVAV